MGSSFGHRVTPNLGGVFFKFQTGGLTAGSKESDKGSEEIGSVQFFRLSSPSVCEDLDPRMKFVMKELKNGVGMDKPPPHRFAPKH